MAQIYTLVNLAACSDDEYSTSFPVIRPSFSWDIRARKH